MTKKVRIPVKLLEFSHTYPSRFVPKFELSTWLTLNNIQQWTLCRECELSYVNAIRDLWHEPKGHIITFGNDDDATLFKLTWL